MKNFESFVQSKDEAWSPTDFMLHDLFSIIQYATVTQESLKKGEQPSLGIVNRLKQLVDKLHSQLNSPVVPNKP